MPAPWLDELNPAQREAVTHGDGPLLVVAGAGTGKTKTLVCRVARLIEQGVPPQRILLLTFTRRAAAEMLARAGRLLGGRSGGGTAKVWGGTFHATANRMLRIYSQALGLRPDFTVMDQGDAADLMGLIRSELGLARGKRRFAQKRTLVNIYSRMVNAQEKLADAIRVHFPWCADDIDGVRRIIEQYTRRKREQNVLDYDDLLLMWNVLANAPEVGATVADRFDHVLVDEYQDTNPVQAELLRAMRVGRPNIMAVGDDAQSIYSFRAATVRNILDFPQHYPGTHVVTLEQNYRSTRPILEASNSIMEQARERYTKDLWSDRPSDQLPVLTTCLDEPNQCNEVCAKVLAHLEEGIPLQRQAVLFRAGHHSDQLEVELGRRNIPFRKYGGLKFVEAAHVKDMIAFLRILENPYDGMSWFRVLQLLPGIGPGNARRVIEVLRGDCAAEPAQPDALDQGVVSPLRRLFEQSPSVPPAARKLFAELRQALADCMGVTLDGEERTPPAPEGEPSSSSGAPPSLPAQVERLRRFYEPVFTEVYENPTIRLRDLEQLEQVAAGYRSRARFVTDLTLDPPEATSDLAQPPHLEEDFLVLSTIHSAKGCEWDVVHVIHAADGMIPSDMAVRDEAGVEEERRLLYVAMTRARDWLYVYFPLRYYHKRFALGDAHGYAQLSRYLTGSVGTHFERRSAYRDETDDRPVGTGSVGEVDAWLNRLLGP
ncbi:MAG: ATP-dependent helicase [bacterium]|nr:ATP-dependent helicase [bacterium]